MELRICHLTDPSRIPELRDLFAQCLSETTPETWVWKHFTDKGLPLGTLLVALDETDKIRAIFGMQPAWYRKGEERILLVQTEDLVIDPACRGQGLMRRLYDYTMDYFAGQGAAGVTAFSCNEKSYPIFLRYGCQELGHIGTISTPKTLLPAFWRRSAWDKNGWQIRICDGMPEDLFCEPCDTAFKMENDYRTIQWKFAQDPDRTYQWLTIRKNGELVGWFVFYANKGRIRSAVNICHWELKDCVDATVLKKAVGVLQRLGNWVGLWGIQTPAHRALWQAAGLTEEDPNSDHFMYHITDGQTPPTQWSITKVDSDN